MALFRIRDFHPDDIDGILHLWEEMRATQAEPVYGLSEVLASCQRDHAVVAVQDDQGYQNSANQDQNDQSADQSYDQSAQGTNQTKAWTFCAGQK